MSESDYWIDLAQYDLETAKAMNASQRFLYVGFMCHQVTEKALKAYYAKHFPDNPPYTHNLALLAQKSGLYEVMSEEQKTFLDFLEPLNIQARYPTQKEKLLSLLNSATCEKLIHKTEIELQWLMKQLEKK